MQRINQALNNMTEAMSDDSDEWIRKLNEDSALTEAKLEMFLDERSSAVSEDNIQDLASEAEMARKSAEDMINQMKREMGLLPKEEATSAKEKSPSTSKANQQQAATDESPSNDSQDIKNPKNKTLGDF